MVHACMATGGSSDGEAMELVHKALDHARRKTQSADLVVYENLKFFPHCIDQSDNITHIPEKAFHAHLKH